MEVICLEEKAFYELIETVVEKLSGYSNNEDNWKWVSDEKAMQLLNIKSKTTLQELRDNGEIRFTQPRKKIIMYDRDSLNEYLEKNAKDTF